MVSLPFFAYTWRKNKYIYDWQGTLNYCAHFISTFFFSLVIKTFVKNHLNDTVIFLS